MRPEFDRLVANLRVLRRRRDVRALRGRLAATMRRVPQAHRDGEIDARGTALLVAQIHDIDAVLVED
jgi:hypothetical protein